MGSVSDINQNKPHILLESLSGSKKHVVPVSFFSDVASGARCITELDDYKDLMPNIISEWLLFLGETS